MHIYTHTTGMCAHIYIYIYIYIYMFMHIPIHTHTYIQAYISPFVVSRAGRLAVVLVFLDAPPNSDGNRYC